MLLWLTLPFYDFCGFRSVAVNSVYKLQFFLHLFTFSTRLCSNISSGDKANINWNLYSNVITVTNGRVTSDTGY